jgi:hypothetical protein
MNHDYRWLITKNVKLILSHFTCITDNTTHDQQGVIVVGYAIIAFNKRSGHLIVIDLALRVPTIQQGNLETEMMNAVVAKCLKDMEMSRNQQKSEMNEGNTVEALGPGAETSTRDLSMGGSIGKAKDKKSSRGGGSRRKNGVGGTGDTPWSVSNMRLWILLEESLLKWRIQIAKFGFVEHRPRLPFEISLTSRTGGSGAEGKKRGEGKDGEGFALDGFEIVKRQLDMVQGWASMVSANSSTGAAGELQRFTSRGFSEGEGSQEQQSKALEEEVGGAGNGSGKMNVKLRAKRSSSSKSKERDVLCPLMECLMRTREKSAWMALNCGKL